MAYVKPIKLVAPFIVLGADDAGPPVTTAQNLTCFAKGIHLMGEEDDALVTFCDPLGYSWILSIDLLMSLGVGSLDEALNALGGPGTIVPFEFAYTDAVASADNPHWTGEVRLSAWPIVDAQVNEPTEFTLEMDVIGEIVRDDGTVTAAVATANNPYATTAPEAETVAA